MKSPATPDADHWRSVTGLLAAVREQAEKDRNTRTAATMTEGQDTAGDASRWKVETGEFYGYVTELNARTGQCKFEFELEPWQHFAKIDDPLLQRPDNKYVQAALTGAKICVIAEALVDDWHQYGWIRILRLAPNPGVDLRDLRSVGAPFLAAPAGAAEQPATPPSRRP